MWCNETKMITAAQARVQNANFRAADKNAIFQLVNKLLATKIKQRRAIKYYDDLRLTLERNWLPSYQNIDEDQLYHCLAQIEQNSNFDGYTKRDYKISIKRMLEHLNNPLSNIIKTYTPAKYSSKFFLTVHDILKMIHTDAPLRDRAIAACLYESNCRPHEFFMLKRNDIRFETSPAKIQNGTGTIDISLEVAYLNISAECKTGARSPPLIFSVPWLKAWLASSEGEYLWIETRGAGKGKQIQYPAARKAIRQLAADAKIANAEKVTLYSFRHGRNTEVSQSMTYAQHCEYAGWHQGSDMPRVYNHLNGASMVSPLLSPYGIQVENSQSERNTWIEIMKTGQKLTGK